MTDGPPNTHHQKRYHQIASAKASGYQGTLDGSFAHDVEEGIEDRQQLWNRPSWD